MTDSELKLIKVGNVWINPRSVTYIYNIQSDVPDCMITFVGDGRSNAVGILDKTADEVADIITSRNTRAKDPSHQLLIGALRVIIGIQPYIDSKKDYKRVFGLIKDTAEAALKAARGG